VNNAIVRPAGPHDVDFIVESIRALARYEKLEHEFDADADRMRTHLFGARPYAEALIGELDGESCGYALYFFSYSTFLSKPGIYLEDLFVKPDSRGKGLGRALLARLAKVAVERDFGRLEWAVLDWNDPAIGFYRSLGAAPNDGWSVYRLTGDALRRLGVGGAAGAEGERG
jgi:GNAT superfamily N-acetyltransferase